jgi:hypothetical protein
MPSLLCLENSKAFESVLGRKRVFISPLRITVLFVPCMSVKLLPTSWPQTVFRHVSVAATAIREDTTDQKTLSCTHHYISYQHGAVYFTPLTYVLR